MIRFEVVVVEDARGVGRDDRMNRTSTAFLLCGKDCVVTETRFSFVQKNSLARSVLLLEPPFDPATLGIPTLL